MSLTGTRVTHATPTRVRERLKTRRAPPRPQLYAPSRTCRWIADEPSVMLAKVARATASRSTEARRAAMAAPTAPSVCGGAI
jgi:hypothetical protein